MNSFGSIFPLSGDTDELFDAPGETSILETEDGHKIEVIAGSGDDVLVSGKLPDSWGKH